MERKQPIALYLILAIIIAFGVGYYSGKAIGEKKAKQVEKELAGRYEYLIGKKYTKPEEVLKTTSGVIKGIKGGTLTLEIPDPDDYLPHKDGSPRNKVTALGQLSSNTDVILVDYINKTETGGPTMSSSSLSELSVGDNITLISSGNVRNDNFPITEIRIIRK